MKRLCAAVMITVGLCLLVLLVTRDDVCVECSTSPNRRGHPSSLHRTTAWLLLVAAFLGIGRELKTGRIRDE
jgi:hypothetical protein